MRTDGRKFVMVYYGRNLHDVSCSLMALTEVLTRNLGAENVKNDKLHYEVLTPKICIRGVSWDDMRFGRLTGLKADECFGFGKERAKYVSKKTLDEITYDRDLLGYILEIEADIVASLNRKENNV